MLPHQQYVCSICGLFGTHKKHKIKSLADLEIAAKAQMAKVEESIKSFGGILGAEVTTLAKYLRGVVRERIEASKTHIDASLKVLSTETVR